MEDVLTDALRARLDALVRDDRVVLFMKGTRSAPRCGFSARVVAILDGLVDDWRDVDVLADMTLREGIKAWAQWPTFPQLWVDGDLVGGADIVEQLHERGELATLLKATPAAPPVLGLTDAARDRIREVAGEARLRLRVDAAFAYQFELADEAGPGDVEVESNGVRLVLDRASARRADGLRMDFVQGPHGAGLVVDNPNEPPRVGSLDVTELKAWLDRGEPFHLLDVRTDDEWAIARIDGARLLDEATAAWLDTLPRDARLAVVCHHGVRSRHAAEELLRRGFRDVRNVEGGIDAWSRRVDPSVPRY
jgi:monothiol glutaredoxin